MHINVDISFNCWHK